MVEKQCVQCGKPFEARGSAKVCSIPCYSERLSSQMKEYRRVNSQKLKELREKYKAHPHSMIQEVVAR